jgi:lysophospholipase L1-like esterase
MEHALQSGPKTAEGSISGQGWGHGKRPALLKKLGLALGATMVAALLGELVARMVLPPPPDRWRDPQLLYVADPQLGFFHLPDQTAWQEDGLARINHLGFRGPELTLPKPKDRFHLVVLGDSITFGAGVNDDETFCAQLEQMLRQKFSDREFVVINCGVSGYDTRQEAILFHRFAPSLQPDLVLVAFYFNDLLPSITDAENGTPPPTGGGTRITAKDHRPDQILRMGEETSWVERTLRRSRALYCAGRVFRQLTSKSSEQDGGQLLTERAVLEGNLTPAIEEGWRSVERALKKIRSSDELQRCPVGIVVPPCREQVTKDYPNAIYQSRVKEIAERLGFFVIDPLPRFIILRSRVDSLFIPYDRHHPAAPGHRLLAETIYDYLQDHKELLKQ